MEPERTAPGSPADLGSKETPGGPANSCKEKHTMQDIFSDIQNVVERSNIINVSINQFKYNNILHYCRLAVLNI